MTDYRPVFVDIGEDRLFFVIDVPGYFDRVEAFTRLTAIRKAVSAPLFGWYRTVERLPRNALDCPPRHRRLACSAATLRARRRKRRRFVWRLAMRSA